MQQCSTSPTPTAHMSTSGRSWLSLSCSSHRSCLLVLLQTKQVGSIPGKPKQMEATVDQLRLKLETQSEKLGVELTPAVRRQVVRWMAALVVAAVKPDEDGSRSAEENSDE